MQASNAACNIPTRVELRSTISEATILSGSAHMHLISSFCTKSHGFAWPGTLPHDLRTYQNDRRQTAFRTRGLWVLCRAESKHAKYEIKIMALQSTLANQTAARALSSLTWQDYCANAIARGKGRNDSLWFGSAERLTDTMHINLNTFKRDSS